MKLIVTFSASALALATGGALAADLAAAPRPPALWTGFYGGFNVGGASVSSGSTDYVTGPSLTGRYLVDPVQWPRRAPFWATQNGAIGGSDDGAFLGGAQIGYNLQLNYLGGIVAGFEADIDGLASRRANRGGAAVYRNILANGDRLLDAASGGGSLQFLGTVRARLGLLVDPTVLVYGTGGLAFGGVDHRLALTSLYANAAGAPAQNAVTDLHTLTTRSGWTAGAGVEWMLAQSWSLKAEYLYYALDSGNTRATAVAYPLGAASAFGGSGRAPADWTTSSVASPRMSGSIVRLGLDYHFGAGAAAAGHGGGAESGGGHGGGAKGQSDRAAAGEQGSEPQDAGPQNMDMRDGEAKGGRHAGASSLAGHGASGAHGAHGAKGAGASHIADASAGGPGGAGDGAHGADKKGKMHTVVPAGVYGAHMVGAGETRFAYTPSYSVMRGNYIDDIQIAPPQVTTIPWVPNSFFALGNYLAANPTRTLRNAPDNMKMQMHMFHAMFGVTDWFNVMVMGSLSDRNMSMTVFKGPSGSTPLGPTNSATEGWGDTAVQGLFRLYQDDVHHLHVNLGLSLPTGSFAEEITHMHPSGQYLTKRGYYGLQLGTGTYDALFGFTYTGRLDAWSWGLVYRGRVATGENSAGYLRGPSNEISAWGGYELLAGLAATGRVSATIWDRIYGHDNLIWGAQQGTVPQYQGGERLKLLGGLEYLVKLDGFKPIRLAVEAGAPVYQRLNGPQIGQSWELNTALNFGF